jgi:hypothetical protein
MIIKHKQVTDMGWKISMMYQGDEAANIMGIYKSPNKKHGYVSTNRKI